MRPGVFTVTLTVTDDQGATASASQRVDVANRPPVAAFSPHVDSSFVAAVMRFDAGASLDPDGRIASYAWDFGDGGAGSGVIAEHRYPAVGEYVVRLTVTDDFAASSKAQSSVTLRPQSEFPVYGMLDLGTLGGADSEGLAINAAGQVTGRADAIDSVHAFRATAGEPMIDLGTLSGAASAHGTAINSSDQVAGTTDTGPGRLFTRAFVVGPGQPMIELGTNGSLASGPHTINDAGQVAFSASAQSGQHAHALLYGPGQPVLDLGALSDGPGMSSEGVAINSAGQVTGSSNVSGAPYHAFLASAGRPMIDLGTLQGGTYSMGRAINAAGLVAGNAETAGGHPHAFVAREGQPMIDLGTLGGAQSAVHDVNDAGQVTGWVETSDGSTHAFLASPITVLFAKLAERTAATPGAAHLTPMLTSARAAYEDRDLPSSCDGLASYDAAVMNLTPGQIPQADAHALLKQSEAIAEILECP